MTDSSPVTAADDPERHLAKLVGALAHEIKNPLSTIRLNLELLGEELGGESTRHSRSLRRIGTLQRECTRLQDLLDRFLQFVKVHQLRLVPADLNQQVQTLIELYRPQAEKAKIDLIPYLEADLPPVLLDPETFRSALLNLVLNAEQAMPDGGQLVFRTSRSGDSEVVLDLIDTGSGMDAQTLGQVFEAFYSTKPTGTGLGLPTARKIIEAHGGQVRVQSAPGKGTQFSLCLPVATIAKTHHDDEDQGEI